jgi:predicted dehydrogenase/nucleoside-diphosphate-sugar epimerase
MRDGVTPLKLGIIGCGAITEQSYLPVLAKLQEYRVISLIDLDLTKARILAERYGISHYSQVMDDIPATTEAIIVALPHHLHSPVSCDLMRRGLHVFCEKPMATTKAGAEAMVRCAEENGVQLSIGNIRRFYWNNRAIKEIVQSKELGALVAFHIEEGYVHDWPTTSGFFFDKEKAGGGVLTDIGAHVLDLLFWWLDDYPTVLKYQDDNFGGVEAECQLELCFGTSLTGMIRLSRLVKLQNTYTLSFEHGTITYQPYDPGGICNAITIERHGKKRILKAKTAKGFHDYFKEQLIEFFHSVRTKRYSTITATSIIPSIRLIGECYQNASRLELPWVHNDMPCITTVCNNNGSIDMRKSKILITGASGFIGGRAAERLYFDYGNISRCLVRNFNKLSRLSRFPVEVIIGDVLDPESLLRATAGCDVVIHCAYGTTEDEGLNTKINVVGTENLVRACSRNKVKKFIYLSSVEVYGENQPLIVDERTKVNTSKNDYGNSKLKAEELCLKYFKEQSLPVVILRLAVVYGPHSPIWTLAVVNRLLSRGYCLSDQFAGICNPVYVDDCVDAVLLAVTNSSVDGEVFLISSGERITWNEYYSKYNEILGLKPLASAGKVQLQLYHLTRMVFDIGFNRLRSRYGNKMFFTYSHLRERQQMPNLKGFLQRGSLLKALDIYSRSTYYSIEKAKSKLHFEPRYSFNDGMLLVKQWLRHSSRDS